MDRIQIVAVIVVAVIVVGIAGVILTQNAGNKAEWNAFCAQEDLLADLPVVIPHWLFIDVTDEWGHVLEGNFRQGTDSSLRNALAIYNFSDRVIPTFEAGEIEVGEDDHTVRLLMILDRESGVPALGMGALPSRTLGRMCSNFVLVPFHEDPEILTRLLIHELGHFFGLYHEDWTYMRGDARFGWWNRFNARQVDILDSWNHPGTPYVSHWNYQKPFWVEQKTELVGLSLIAGLIAILVAIWMIRSRRPPLG